MESTKAKKNKTEFTPAQKNAIEVREGNILVAAAAGSGKTSVLSERVVGLVTDDTNPIPIENILVATFTKASASEMKHRISKTLNKKITEYKDLVLAENDPINKGILEKKLELYELQKLKIPNARISTIDSMCSSLVKENFQKLDISSTTRIASSVELNLLENEIANEILDECYDKNDKNFHDLVELTCTKDDSALLKMLLKSYDYIRSFPYPLGYLEEVKTMYGLDGSSNSTIWKDFLEDYIKSEIESFIELTSNYSNSDIIKARISECIELTKPVTNTKAFVDAIDECVNLTAGSTHLVIQGEHDNYKEVQKLCESGSFVDALVKLNAMPFDKLTKANNDEKAIRKASKKIHDDFIKKFYTPFETQIIAGTITDTDIFTNVIIQSEYDNYIKASEFFEQDLFIEGMNTLNEIVFDTLRGVAKDISENRNKAKKICKEKLLDKFYNSLLKKQEENQNQGKAFTITNEIITVNPILKYENEQYQEALEKCKKGDFIQALKVLKSTRFDTLSGAEPKIKNKRDLAKTTCQSFAKRYFYAFALYDEDMSALPNYIETFFAILKDYYNRLKEKKRELEIMDYSDLEHYALDLLVDEKDGQHVQSAVASELSQSIDYILVDECQDINKVQDTIFKFLSRYEGNIFMVGDVKQSIYRFRKASPELFAEKKSQEDRVTLTEKNTLADLDGDKATILLNKNFRSRDVVCNTVNFIFEQLMSAQIGGIDYDDTEKLVCGRGDYFENENAIPEFHIVERSKEDTRDHREVEADYIAKYILKMIKVGYEVLDEDGKTKRKCQLKDFAILLRNKKTVMEIYHKQLESNGVSTTSNYDKSFFENYDVSVTINLLKIINNPLDDIAFTAVLMSPLFRFTPDMVAKIKLVGKRQTIWSSLYNIVSMYKTKLESTPNTDATLELEEVIDPQTGVSYTTEVEQAYQNEENNDVYISLTEQEIETEKTYDDIQKEWQQAFVDNLDEFIEQVAQACTSFCNKINALRRKSTALSMTKLLQFIYDDTNFLALMSAKCSADVVYSNMQSLLSHTKDYESFSRNGLSGFVNFVTKLIDINNDFEGVTPPTSQSNTVKLISIHESKGLEFPICIIANCSGDFNKSDVNKANYMFDPTLGFCLKLVNFQQHAKHNPLPYQAIRLQKDRDGVSEELRVMYVALTRAKEKLIMVGGIKASSNENASSKISKTLKLSAATGVINPNEVFSYTNFQDWLIVSLLQLKDDTKDKTVTSKMIDGKNVVNFVLVEQQDGVDETTEEEVVVVTPMPVITEPELEPKQETVDIVKAQIMAVYEQDELTKTPAKSSVTKLAKENHAKKSNHFTPLKGDLVFKNADDTTTKATMTGAQKGTILHNFMQYADFDNAIANLENEIQRLIEKKYLTKVQTDFLDKDSIKAFLQSKTYVERMAVATNTVKREFKFNFFIDANKVNPELGEDDTNQIFVQGIADCLVFAPNGDITIIDYKTDRVQTTESDKDDNYTQYKARLTEQYKQQMVLYSNALNEIFGAGKVKDAYLYSLAINEEIEIKI